MIDKKPTLFLSYSWKDNVASDVDFVAQEIESQGIKVKQDRFAIIAGQRLWPQIEKAISDPDQSDGWAIFLTQNSLQSEPIREEMAYALDRALTTRGANYSLIGISTGAVNAAELPRMIGSRLFVDLRDRDWVERVRSAVLGQLPNIQRSPVFPVEVTWHKYDGKPVMEIRPRAGRWYPVYFSVPNSEAELVERCAPGPSGSPTGFTIFQGGQYADKNFQTWRLTQNVTPIESLYVYFSQMPSRMIFGDEKTRYEWKRESGKLSTVPS